jgi:Holliday junction resolvase
MGKMSRQKGKKGELEFAHLLTDNGFDARRGCQFAGGPDSPDIQCDALSGYHFEVKRTETLSVYTAMEQAQEDAGGKIPVVCHRRNAKPWLVIMKAEDFLKMLKRGKQ